VVGGNRRRYDGPVVVGAELQVIELSEREVRLQADADQRASTAAHRSAR